jgi:nucleoside-diphosphate-sugar epimerase
MQGLSGKPLTIYGDGLQTRSFCYVTDTVRGIVTLAGLQSNPRTPINIGNPDEYTILDLAKKVREKLGGSIEFVYPAPVDDPLQRKPDIKIAKELLDWCPIVSIDEGLERMFEYYKGNHAI